MAFVNKSTKILLLLAIFSSTAFANLDCGGKAFLCVNSTHFNICVDFGNGISSTVDDFIIPCPPGTECRRTNRFECEIYAPTIPAAIDSMNDAMNDGKAKEERSVSTTPMWEVVTTNVPVPSYHDAQYSDKYLNTENSIFFTNSVTFGPLDFSTTVSTESNVLSEVTTFSVPASKQTVSDKDNSPSVNVITGAHFSVNPILENEGPSKYILTSATTTESTASPARSIFHSYTTTRHIPQEVSPNHYEMTELPASKITPQGDKTIQITSDSTTADFMGLIYSTEKAFIYDKLSITEKNWVKETIDDLSVVTESATIETMKDRMITTESATTETFENIPTATESATKHNVQNNRTSTESFTREIIPNIIVSTEGAFKEIIQRTTENEFSEIATIQDIATSTKSATMATIQDTTNYTEHTNIQSTTNSIDSIINETIRNSTTSLKIVADTTIQSITTPPESTNIQDATTQREPVTILDTNTYVENATIPNITTSPESLSIQDSSNFSESVTIQDTTIAQESSTIHNTIISTESMDIQSTTNFPESTTIQNTTTSLESFIEKTIQDPITFAKSTSEASIKDIKTSPKSTTSLNTMTFTENTAIQDTQSSTESVILENTTEEILANVATKETILDVTTQSVSIVTHSPTEWTDSKLMLDESTLVTTEQQKSSPPIEWGIVTIDSPTIINADASELTMPASESSSTVSESVPTLWSESDVASRPAIISPDQSSLSSKPVVNMNVVPTEKYTISGADNIANIMQKSSTKTYTDSEFHDTKQPLPLELITDKIQIQNKPTLPVIEMKTGNEILRTSINNVSSASEQIINDTKVRQKSNTQSDAVLEFYDATQPSAAFEMKEHRELQEAAVEINKTDIDSKTELATEMETRRAVENFKEKEGAHEFKTERNKTAEFYYTTESLASEIPTQEPKIESQSSIFEITTKNTQKSAITEIISKAEISSRNPLNHNFFNYENKPQDVVFVTTPNNIDNDDKGITIIVDDRMDSVGELQDIMKNTTVEVITSHNQNEAVGVPTASNGYDSIQSHTETITAPDVAAVLNPNTVSPPSETPTSSKDMFEQPISTDFSTIKSVSKVSNIPLNVVTEDEPLFQPGKKLSPDTRNTIINTDDVIGADFPWLQPKEQSILESSDHIKMIEARLDDGFTEPTIKITTDSIIITDSTHTYTVKVSVEKTSNSKKIDGNSNLLSKISEALSRTEQVNSVADTMPKTTSTYILKAATDQPDVDNNEIINIYNEPREMRQTTIKNEHVSTFLDHSAVDLEVPNIPEQTSSAIVKKITEKENPNHYTIGQIERSSKSQIADQHIEVSKTPATTFATIDITTPASTTKEENTVSQSHISFATNGLVTNDYEITTPVNPISNVMTNKDNEELSEITISPMRNVDINTATVNTDEKIVIEESITDSGPKQITQFNFSEEKLEDDRILATAAVTVNSIVVTESFPIPSEANLELDRNPSSISASTDSVNEIQTIGSTSINPVLLGDIKKSADTLTTQQVDNKVLAIPTTTVSSVNVSAVLSTSSTRINVSKLGESPSSFSAMSIAGMSTTTEHIINANIGIVTECPVLKETVAIEDTTQRVEVLTTQEGIKVPTSTTVTYGPVVVTNPFLSNGGIVVSEIMPAQVSSTVQSLDSNIAKETLSNGLEANANGLASAERIGTPTEVIDVKSITSFLITSTASFKRHNSVSRTAIKDTTLVDPNTESYGLVESIFSTILPSTGKESQTTPTTLYNDTGAIDKIKNETRAEERSKNYTTTNATVSNSKAESTTINPVVKTTVTPTVNQNIQTPRPKVKTPSAAKLKFDCTNLSRGRYSDEVDCRKFYICIDKPHPVVGHCPLHTVFSEITRQCVRNLSHCIRGNEFKCAAPGRFVDFNRENIYYLCVRSGNIFLRFKFQCQNGYTLDRIDVRCKQNVESENESHSTSESHSSKKSSTDNGSGENEFSCKKAGNFPHQSDCRKYYICYKTKKSGLKRKVGKCDSDEVFNPDKKKCVDDDSYECQL